MSGFSFGTQPVTQSQTPAFGGFSFGAPTNTTATSSTASAFSGSGGNVSSTGSGFGISSTGIFGPNTTQSSSFLPTTTSSSLFPSLGQMTTSAPSSGFSFGGFGTTPTGGALGFGVSNPTGTGLGFGITNTSSTAPLGLGMQLNTSVPSSVSSIGLGGVDTQSSGLNGTDATGKKDSKAVKETLIPSEISVTVESFKKYVKEQKGIREEMSRVSSKNIFRVQNQVASLKQQLSVVKNGLQRNAIAIAKLKQESGEELKNAEIAQRTKETPPALQYENTAPSEYFHNLAINFEHQMQVYRQQIEQLERHLLSLSQPSVLTSNELNIIMRKLHDTFVTLAAQLQTVHQQVQYHKDQFLSIQKASHGDLGNVFQPLVDTAMELTSSNYLPTPVTTGPSPVSSIPCAAAVALANARNRTQQLRTDGMNLNSTALNASGLSASTGLMGGSLSTSQQGFGSGLNLSNTSTFKPLGK